MGRSGSPSSGRRAVSVPTLVLDLSLKVSSPGRRVRAAAAAPAEWRDAAAIATEFGTHRAGRGADPRNRGDCRDVAGIATEFATHRAGRGRGPAEPRRL